MSEPTAKAYVAFWTKDGRWHTLESHQPTDEERRLYPSSYPSACVGPFYRWASRSFDTEADARESLKN